MAVNRFVPLDSVMTVLRPVRVPFHYLTDYYIHGCWDRTPMPYTYSTVINNITIKKKTAPASLESSGATGRCGILSLSRERERELSLSFSRERERAS
jgi:hypothetical protein